MSHFNCKESIAKMLEYLDGDLSAEMRERLDQHFGGCAPCEDFLKSYRATPAVCRKALARKMPDEVANKLTDFLRAELGTPQGSSVK